ncbi:MAG: sugar transferase [Clostridia bacterium]|nr:sugar transferase [Clostridia bacterium]
MRHKNKSLYVAVFKRPLDFILSFLAIIFLMPLMLIIALLVRVKLGSPVLFKHPRPGKNEKKFYVYKFRSMTDEKDEKGQLLPDEKRLTSFGLKLRATSLDELPELFLILVGKMSLVGPRPLEMYFLPYYNEEEHHRHDVLPGLTGLAQVNGRNDLSWEEKFKYDLEYVNNISFLLDCKIVIQTIIKVFRKEGVVEEGGATLVDFDVERRSLWKKAGIDFHE